MLYQIVVFLISKQNKRVVLIKQTKVRVCLGEGGEEERSSLALMVDGLDLRRYRDVLGWDDLWTLFMQLLVDRDIKQREH